MSAIPNCPTQMQGNDGGATRRSETDESARAHLLKLAAVERIRASNVLIVGMKGLGAEIAKNIALAGVKSLSLLDPAPAALPDLSSQFFLSEAEIGKPRDQVTAPHLAKLNTQTLVHIHESTEQLSQFDKYQVVILTNAAIASQKQISDYCHSKGIYVIITDTFGLFGSIFCDFGKGFTVSVPTDEPLISGCIQRIENGLVYTADAIHHGLEDGDFVTFTAVEGIDGLNGCEPKRVAVLSPSTFSIGNVSSLPEGVIHGGMYHQVKMPKVIDFKRYTESLNEPEFLISDHAKSSRPQQLHVGFQAMHVFRASEGRLPHSMDDRDAAIVISAAKKLWKERNIGIALDESLIRELSYQALGDLSAMATFFGGLAAHEALKAVSGTYNPVRQWMYFDSLESLPSLYQRTVELCKPTGSRYDGQIAVFGRDYQDKVGFVKPFLVGTGAMGCEMLKNWSLIGLGSGPEGRVFIADPDPVQQKHVDHQFLFRNADIGCVKGDCAANFMQRINSDFDGHVHSFREHLERETMNVFNDDFWEPIDGVAASLDDAKGIEYLNECCILYSKLLLDGSTLGSRGSTQVVYPYLTQSYYSALESGETSACKTRPAHGCKSGLMVNNISPSTASTIAAVSGLVGLELYKVIDDKLKIDQYKNSLVNLASPFFEFSVPIASSKVKYTRHFPDTEGAKEGEKTEEDVELDMTWDRYNLKNVKIQELIDFFKVKGLTVHSVRYGCLSIYASSTPTCEARLPLKITDAIEKVMNEPLSSHMKELFLNVSVDKVALGNVVDDGTVSTAPALHFDVPLVKVTLD